MLCRHEPELLNLLLNHVKLFWQWQRKLLTIAFTTFLPSAVMTFATNAGCMKHNVISHHSKTDYWETPGQPTGKDGLQSCLCCTETASSPSTSHPGTGTLILRRTVSIPAVVPLYSCTFPAQGGTSPGDSVLPQRPDLLPG